MKWTDINTSYAVVPANVDDAQHLPAGNSNTMFDNRLRSKIAQLEQGVDRLHDQRQMLERNVAQVKSEIGACFAHQLAVLRSRENTLYAELAQLAQSQFDDIDDQENKLTELIHQCSELVGDTGNQYLSTIKAIQCTPPPRHHSTHIEFMADTGALRDLLQQFGQLAANLATESCNTSIANGDIETSKWLLKQQVVDEQQVAQRLASLAIAKKIDEHAISFTDYFAKVLSQPNDAWLLKRASSKTPAVESEDSSFDLCCDVESIADSDASNNWLARPPANANRQSTIEAILVPQKHSDRGIPFADVFREVLDSDRQLWLATPRDDAEPMEEAPLSAAFNEYLASLPRNQQQHVQQFHPYPCACCYNLDPDKQQYTLPA